MLLGDFHIHTTWSDGKLELPEVVDLFGRAGHDVIAITDHVVNSDHPVGRISHRFGLTLTPESFPAYREEIEHEAKRAWDQYRMIVIAGVELTRNAIRRKSSAHALALDVDEYVSADGTVEEMLENARKVGAITVACHPNEMSDWYANTFYLWDRREGIGELVDLWEIACRWDLFPPVARAKLPYIGNSDFHEGPHLWAWKTLLPCQKDRRAILKTLRAGVGLAIRRLEPSQTVPATRLALEPA